MPTITIPEHKREINEDGWECIDVRRPKLDEKYLTNTCDVLNAPHDNIISNYPILKRKELQGWDWIRTMGQPKHKLQHNLTVQDRVGLYYVRLKDHGTGNTLISNGRTAATAWSQAARRLRKLANEADKISLKFKVRGV